MLTHTTGDVPILLMFLEIYNKTDPANTDTYIKTNTQKGEPYIKISYNNLSVKPREG